MSGSKVRLSLRSLFIMMMVVCMGLSTPVNTAPYFFLVGVGLSFSLALLGRDGPSWFAMVFCYATVIKASMLVVAE